MTDLNNRELERQAAQGDEQAGAQLLREQERGTEKCEHPLHSLKVGLDYRAAGALTLGPERVLICSACNASVAASERTALAEILLRVQGLIPDPLGAKRYVTIPGSGYDGRRICSQCGIEGMHVCAGASTATQLKRCELCGVTATVEQPCVGCRAQLDVEP